MTKLQRVFGIREPDGSWVPFDEEASRMLEKGMEDLQLGTPGCIIVRDEGDETHVLTYAAVSVLRLALLALDARLRPQAGIYRERADELYTLLATLQYQDAVASCAGSSHYPG